MKLKADFGAIALIAILFAVIGLFISSMYDFLQGAWKKANGQQ